MESYHGNINSFVGYYIEIFNKNLLMEQALLIDSICIILCECIWQPVFMIYHTGHNKQTALSLWMINL